MLTLYADEFQMLLQKSYIVLYLTEPGVQNAKEKTSSKYEGPSKQRYLLDSGSLYGPIPKEVSQKVMDCTRPLSHFFLEDQS